MENNRTLVFVNPATGEQFGQVAMHTLEQVNRARSQMQAAFDQWSRKSVEERVSILRKFQSVLLDSADEITAVLNQDCGKSRQDGLIELVITADVLHQYLRHAPGWLRKERVSSGLYFLKRSTVESRPYGVVGVIAPWNYPFALAMPPVLGALLAGNTVLLKPSEVTGATGVLMESLFQRVPELAPFVRVLHGDASVGEALVESAPDYIFLTGSTLTGKRVLKAAAEHLTPVACELGGKDAMIVLEDADIEAAAHWGAWGSFFNAGQTCMAVERVYVVEPVYESFVRSAVEHTRRLAMGYSQALKSPYYLGPVTDPRQLRVIETHLADAVEKGARILAGGNRKGMFFEPTVLVDVDHSMLLMREETFGPLMPVMKVRDEAQAIELANDSHFGLGASIWSQDLDRAQRVAGQVQAASILINDTIAQFAIVMLPFGGIKQSGYGRIHGKQGLLQFTRPYAYVVSKPPVPWDLATIARSPGNYHTVASVMRLFFGTTPAQRMQPIKEALDQGFESVKKVDRKWSAGLALGALGALAGVVWAQKRSK